MGTLGRMRGRGGDAFLSIRGKNLPRTLIRHGLRPCHLPPLRGKAFGARLNVSEKARAAVQTGPSWPCGPIHLQPLPYMTHLGASPPNGSPLVGELSREA